MNDAPAIVFLDTLLARACAHRASDIHLEPAPESFQVRFRIDGLLCAIMTVEPALGLHVIARIKVLSALNAAERRMPQDGKFEHVEAGQHGKVTSRAYDVRVSTFPCVHGEKVVLRILHTEKQQLLEALGLSPRMYTEITSIVSAPQGFFLVTGPTGSGKTTTLHALLSFLNTAEKNIVTLEDPVEYSLAGITQTQIHPEIGFTFAKGIRSLLRADPDVIMVGEIRDTETAHVALQAAMTGHSVLSSLHTNDAPSALLRLLDMACEPFLITASVTAVLAQRLARRLCENCRFETQLTDQEREILKRLNIHLDMLWKSRGCSACLLTGYYGRVGIFQLLIMSESIRALVTERPTYSLLFDAAHTQGMRSLTADASDKLAQGITSLAEIVRILA